MKSKESPNLYEILKTTVGQKQAADRPAISPKTPQTTAVEESAKSTPIEVPLRSLSSMSLSSPVTPSVGKEGDEAGEKIIRITYNTAIFLVLIGMGLLFISYVLGVRSGRAGAMSETPMRPVPQERVQLPEETAPPVPVERKILASLPQKVTTIKLLEWSGETARDRVKAQQNAERIKKSLTQNGFPASYYELATRNDKKYVVLRYGKYGEQKISEARRMLEKLRQFRYRGTAYFTRAGLESIDKD